ncbi:MAG: hypothetical protein Q4G14_14310 [Paracoccus sp. (in: a-proteobacteria)]|uniref:hypothetical protein n=1 Tax=Paracoccus sp. TaxID=267 RepID=UPI0026DED756|nr:hypothetical protein [Paracoccus sp. (in: a-proteobacteria)]MDO5614400.1 hypothetical protein [Paracoccus sp. (in: a-proteobacteria)]
MYLIAIFATLCGLSVLTQHVWLGLALTVAPWLTTGAAALLRGRGATGGTADPRLSRPPRPPELAAMADRLRSRLDANAAMVAQAALDCGAGNDLALRDQLLTFCQHALQRDDMFALASNGSSLAEEFRAWLGDHMIAHIRQNILPRSDLLPRPALTADHRLIAHARRHGWLAPTTLALARAGNPPAVAPPRMVTPRPAAVMPRLVTGPADTRTAPAMATPAISTSP